MKENFLHFLSSVPCILSINGKRIGPIDNENILEQDILTRAEELILEYQPISGENLFVPYFAILKTKDIPHTNNQCIKIIPFPENNYDILLSPFYYKEMNTERVLINQNLGQYFVSIVVGTNTNITVFDGASIVYKTTTKKLSSATAELRSKLLIVKGIISKDEYYLLVLNLEKIETLYSDICHSIEEDNASLQCLQFLRNITHHAKVCKIEYNTQKKEVFYVYENDTEALPNCKHLVPLYFLEALSVSDSNICKKLLSMELQNTPLDKFKNYFGNIKGIHLNRHSISPNINYTIESDTYKNYDFVIRDNKIVEIEEIF